MRKREIGAFAMNPAKHLFYNGFPFGAVGPDASAIPPSSSLFGGDPAACTGFARRKAVR